MKENVQTQQPVETPSFFAFFMRHILPIIKRTLWHKRVPVFTQMTRAECGIACLAMIFSYYGRPTSLAELRTKLGAGRDGLSASSIVKAARAYGMRVRALSLPNSELRHVTLPTIVHWQFNHFLVVERWSKKSVQVVDPASGRRHMTKEEFDEGFTGVTITLEPSIDFDRVAAIRVPSLKTYLLQMMGQTPGTVVQILGASLILQLLGLVLPLLTALVIDYILPSKTTNLINVLGLGMLLLLLSQVTITLLREWLLVYLRSRTDIQMVLGFFEHLLALPYSFFQQRATGDILTRMGSNAIIRDTLSSQVISAILDGGLVTVYLFILLCTSIPFGLLALAIGFLKVVFLLSTYGRVRELSSRELTAQGKSQGYLAEVLSGIATVKAAGAEPRTFEYWANLFFEQLNISVRRSYLSAIMGTGMMALHMLSPIALLWIGALQVLQGSMTVGTMLALNTLATTFLSPLSSLVASAQQLQVVQAHFERLTDVMGAEAEQNTQIVTTPPRLTGHMRLVRVAFQYAPEAPKVLKDINLTIAAGQKVAIVGRTGSGKSTLGNLLLGLHIPTEGSILYDGIPLQHLNYQDVRRQFGVVLQNATIFSGSIRQNIAFNDPTMSMEQLQQAAHIADIHDDILRMPMGYETPVAEGGNALSGGQRQRLAIARAVAHEPAMILLDEATSNLDVVTERKVSHNLRKFACTQVIIAHRLSTIRDADLVLVLDQGSIVEQGTHMELLQRGGYYATLIHHQLEKEGMQI